MDNRPEAYEGTEPYIFVSYAHKDSPQVLPILTALHEKGFRIWYDAGIEAGTEWPPYIARHLKGSQCVLIFLSQNAIESLNCRQEIAYAIAQNRDMLVAHLEQLTLPEGLDMQLGIIQAIFRYHHSTQESFLNALCASKLLQACRELPKPQPKPAKPAPPPKPEPTPVPAPEPKPTPTSVPKPEPTPAPAPSQQAKTTDYNAAKREHLLTKAQNGDVEAQYDLARKYLLGLGTFPWDSDQALHWLCKAADQGYMPAAVDIVLHGKIQRWHTHLDGTKLIKYANMVASSNKRDDLLLELVNVFMENDHQAVAIKLVRKEARLWNGDALKMLGDWYREGKGVRQSTRKANKYYRYALSHWMAKSNRPYKKIAEIYENGYGDLERAETYYGLAHCSNDVERVRQKQKQKK